MLASGMCGTLPARLGAEELLYNRRGANELRDLAYYLCPAEEPTTIQAQRAVLWAGNMVALMAGQDVIVVIPLVLGAGWPICSAYVSVW